MLILEMASVTIISINYAIAIIVQWQPRKKPIMKNSKTTGYANMCQQIFIYTLMLSLLKTTHMSSFSEREISKRYSKWLYTLILPTGPTWWQGY